MLIIFLFIIFIGLLIIGTILVINSTEKREGKWGINTNTVMCPRCGLALPKIRKPENLRQALWGGWTCKNCSCEVDK
jgi:hypothetical protein